MKMPFFTLKIFGKNNWQNTQLGKNFDIVERSSTKTTWKDQFRLANILRRIVPAELQILLVLLANLYV